MHDWSKVISAGVGPIIVISACGLLCLAFYNRLAAMVTRLRAFHRERLEQQDRLDAARSMDPPDERAVVRCQELIGMLETQTRQVTQRAKLIRSTLICLLGTIICLTICSLALGLSIFHERLIYPAAVMFIVGLAMLVVGVIFALLEIKHALDPVDLESRFVREMVDQS